MRTAFITMESGDRALQFVDEIPFDTIRNFLADEFRSHELRLLESPDQIWLDVVTSNNAKLTLHWDIFAGLILIARNSLAEGAIESFAQLIACRGRKGGVTL